MTGRPPPRGSRHGEGPDLAPRYRDLALLKAHLLHPERPDQARLVLGVLAEPGAPYAALAEEQLALLDIAEGDIEAGIDRCVGWKPPPARPRCCSSARGN
jgi:hypothetical protein